MRWIILILSTVFVVGCGLTAEETGSIVGGSAHAVREGAETFLRSPSVTGLVSAVGVAVLGIWNSVSTVLQRKKQRELQDRNMRSDLRKANAERKIVELQQEIERLKAGGTA